MKGIKIKIIKEQIESDCSIHREIVLGNQIAVGQDFESCLMAANLGNEKIYNARKVYSGFGDTPIIYFVEEDDNGIFNDLIQVSNDDIKKQYNNGVAFGKLYTLERVKSFLRNPWYKRIFVKKHLKNIKDEIDRIKITQS